VSQNPVLDDTFNNYNFLVKQKDCDKKVTKTPILYFVRKILKVEKNMLSLEKVSLYKNQ
jgi:hypothetical protein